MADLLLFANTNLGTGVRIAAVVATTLMLALVLELVRRRRLVERYALAWMVIAAALFVIAIWPGPLHLATHILGIKLQANTLFLAAFGVAFLMLLNFSVITTRLSEETQILAQEVARLDHALRSRESAGTNGDQPADGDAEPARSSASTTDQ
jgi:hypothetical protein